MTFWCIQDNECLACVGGCVGYEWKREAMRERRADFWCRVHEYEVEAKETKTMGYNDTQAKQGALNTDTLLHREPNLNSRYSDNKLSRTQQGYISIEVNNYVITKTLKQWHTLAADDFKRQDGFAAQIKAADEGGLLATAEAARKLSEGPWIGMDFSKVEERVIGSLAPDTPVKAPTFAQKLASLLNEASKERGSNTPDFVLAEYLTNCLGNFEAATKAREKFYGVSSRPGDPSFSNEKLTITKMEHSHLHAIELNEQQVRDAKLWPVI